MTDDDDPEPAAGIPERIERTESGGNVTDSGRLVTNRNVVPRNVDRSETSGLRDLRKSQVPRAASPDAFDLVTPVRPQPRDIFEEEDATLSHDDEPSPDAAPAAVVPEPPIVERAADGSHITPPYAAGVRGQAAVERGSRGVAGTPGTPVPPGAITQPRSAAERSRSDAGAAYSGTSWASPEGPPSDTGFVPPGPRRPGTEPPSRITPFGALDPRRPSTVRGHVEPRRRPTTPPPASVEPVTAEAASADAELPGLGSGQPALDPTTGAGGAPSEPHDQSVIRSAIDPTPVGGTSGGFAAGSSPPGDRYERARRDTPRGMTARDPGAAAASPSDRLPQETSARPPRATSPPPALTPEEERDRARDRAIRETPRLVLTRPPSPSSEPSPYDLAYSRPPRDSRRAPTARPFTAPSEPSPYEPSRGQANHEPRRPRTATDQALSERPTAASRLDRVLRGAAILAVLGLGAVGLLVPGSVLRGGVSWLAFLVFVLTGWGAIVARVARVRDPDIGLRAAFGAAGYLAIAGVLVAAGLLTRPVLLFLIAIGVAGFAWRELTTPIATWQRIREAARFMRRNPALGAVITVLVLLACVRLLGAVAALDRNPWDDDLAYTPFVKRLLDTGNLVEPFSFRRLGAYGGQSVLQALGAARGSIANVHLVDKGLGLCVALLVLVGYARERRTQALWLALLVLLVLLLPDTAINTASYWTGVMMFLALYRAVVRAYWPLVGVLGAATCTLRQNFLVPVVVFVAAVLIIRLCALARTMPVREAWHDERRSWALVAGVALAVMVPWWIAAYASSHTFLYPIFEGNWNHQLSLGPAVTTWPQELGSLLTLCLEPAPVVVIPILAVVIVFATDRRTGRPLAALFVSSVIGLVLLAHSIVGGEPYHLWRYAFGFATALVAVLVIEVGSDDDSGIALVPLGRWLVLAALVLQIAFGRGALPKQAIALFNDVREAQAIDRHGDPSARVEQRRYTAMQAAIPVGARTIVMLDDPAMLDYRRNPIASLDTPGFASPGSQLPAFAGAEPLRTYLVAEGYRYAAFVRSDRSRYFYRRPFWIWRLFNDAELFETMSAYTIDAIDSFAELATTTKVLYDSDGLVVIDLAQPLREASRRPVIGDEPSRRGAWVRELADREGLHDAWSLTTRSDVRFEDGTGALRYAASGIDDPAWNEVSATRTGELTRGTPILPLYRRAHLRVRGPASTSGAAPTDMRLVLRAAVALNTVQTRPRLDVSLDGVLLASAVADQAGRYTIAVTVPRAQLTTGWHDLYLVFSSIADPGKDIRDVRIARLESLEWAPP